MIKPILTLTGLVAILLSGIKLKAQSIHYTLTGNAGHYNTPAKVYLFYNDKSGSKIDSAILLNGRFILKGKLDAPHQAALYYSKTGSGVESGEGHAVFFLENGNINVKFKDGAQNAEVLGGSLNRDNNRLNNSLAENNAGLTRVGAAMAALTPRQKENKTVIDSIYNVRDALLNVRKQIYTAFIKGNPASMMALFALKSYPVPFAEVKELEPLFNSLSLKIRESTTGRVYAEGLKKMKQTEIGASAPDFSIADTAGHLISLHDYKGKYVLLDFWASWCPPCRADNPNVLKLYNAYKDKNFTVISISLDHIKENWLKAIHEDGLPWKQLSDLKAYNPGSIARLYELHSVPQNFLIGPDGKILNKALSAAGLPDKLQELINQ